SYDADNRPLLVMRSNLWASGYDVDGTDQTSLGQFSGRVQQTYKHSVPRFFVPEHGTMFTLALVRFPPTATKEIQYLNDDGSNKLNRSRKARVSYKVQRTINASLNAATSTRAVSSNPNFVTRQKI